MQCQSRITVLECRICETEYKDKLTTWDEAQDQKKKKTNKGKTHGRPNSEGGSSSTSSNT